MTDSSKKNILLISFDDCVAYHHYRSVFGQAMQIPNLDRITGTSTHFQSAYCQAPVCGPSRASFMSGLTPHQLGIFNNSVNVFDKIGPEEIWSSRLKQDGYFCSSGGKMHHGYGALPPTQHKALYSDGPKRFGNDFKLPPDVEKRRYHGIRGGWGTTDPKDDGIFYDAKSAESAISFFENYDGDRPFYREVGFFSPHGPRFTPARFKDMYNPYEFAMPKAWATDWAHEYSDREWEQTPELVKRNRGWWQHNVRNYFAALSHGDHQLGRVWDALKSSRFADNTVVVIVSDHGFLLGTRNRFYKSTLWEQSAGVPLIVHDPEIAQARVVTDPVALLDVGPTILDYAGQPMMENRIGRSLRPQVEGGSDPDRVVPTFRYDNVGIRKGNYRFIRYEDESTQLYDLTRDIWNVNDLGKGHPQHRVMEAALMEVSEHYGCRIEKKETRNIG